MKAFSIAKKVLSAVMAAVICCICCAPISTSCEEEQLTLPELADRVVVLVNEARAEAGLKPLKAVPYLNDRANVRARECIEIFDHKRPTGEKFSTVIDQNVVPFSYIAENIAAALPTAEATFDQWRNSRPHWSSILNTILDTDPATGEETKKNVDFDYIGIGVCYEENSPYGWYWAMLLVDYDGELPGAYIAERYKVVPKCAGDLTGDGTVNCFDYILLKRKLFGELYLNDLQMESADVLVDGNVNVSDLIIMRRYLMQNIKKIPITADELLQQVTS